MARAQMRSNLVPLVLATGVWSIGCAGDDAVANDDDSTGTSDGTGEPTTGPVTVTTTDDVTTDPSTSSTSGVDSTGDGGSTDSTSGGTTGGSTGDESSGTTTGDTCGNGQLDPSEACDGDELDGEDCASQGFVGGELTCAPDCTFDTTMCADTVCGDIMVQGDEECDGAALLGQTCLSLGFDGGTLSCAANCTFDTTMCTMAMCGDGMAQGAELCDGADVGAQTCDSQGFPGGVLACDPGCMAFDTSGCTGIMVCSAPGLPIGPGAGVLTTDTIVLPSSLEFINEVEVDLNASHTFLGDLEVTITHVDTGVTVNLMQDQCGTEEDIDATFDQDAASGPVCASPTVGEILPLESLDAFTGISDPGGTWQLDINDDAGGDGGTLNEWCVRIDVSGVDTNVCGDGQRTFAEDCEGLDLAGEDCVTLGFDFGTLACDGACTFDTTGCGEFVCGNDMIEGVEVCDGTDTSGVTCTDLGYTGGTLGCAVDCTGYDFSSCTGEGPQLLLLGEDTTDPAEWDVYRNALTAAGVTWAEINLDVDAFPSAAVLGAYDTVVWFDEGVIDPSDVQAQIVADWLTSGTTRNLFVAGVDFLWDFENGAAGGGEDNLYLLFETDFAGDFAGAAITTLEGVAADPITGSFVAGSELLLSANSDSNGDFADPLSGALSTPAGIYGPGGTGSGSAGLTHYDSGTYRIVWLGLSFHAGLVDAAQRDQLMSNILTWFGV